MSRRHSSGSAMMLVCRTSSWSSSSSSRECRSQPVRASISSTAAAPGRVPPDSMASSSAALKPARQSVLLDAEKARGRAGMANEEGGFATAISAGVAGADLAQRRPLAGAPLISIHTVTELRHHRRNQLEQRMATGRRSDDGYVFAKPDGSPVHPDYISQTFRRAVAKLDVPRIRLHDLRHTHASILLQQGVNAKVVSERLGHSSVAFTMTVYQHVMPGMQAQAAATFGAAVFGDR